MKTVRNFPINELIINNLDLKIYKITLDEFPDKTYVHSHLKRYKTTLKYREIIPN